MKKKIKFALLALALCFVSRSKAAITLLDQNDWKVLLNGFAELDMFYDSTRSLMEVIGNTPIGRSGTLAGENGRTQFSIRNSRLGFTVIAPTQSNWTAKGVLEFDLLGTNNGPSENSLFTSPTMRVRHAYLSAENDDWKIVAGQTWTLFGWQTYYLPPSVSVAPISGTAYQRTPQVSVFKRFGDLETAASLSRPTQRDIEIPNFDLGARYSFQGRKAPYLNSSSGEISLQPMSIALTGTMRNFEAPNGNGPTGKTRYGGYGVAADAMIPILSSSESDNTDHALVLTGEFTVGQGDGDAFSGWTGNLMTETSSDTSFVPTSVNLDPGIGGFDPAGNFQLIKLTTFNLVLQYHLPAEWHTCFNIGYGRLDSSNNNSLTPLLPKTVAYNRAEVLFANVYHDFTRQIRVGVEYSYAQTSYADGVIAHNNRLQISSWFRL